MKKHLAWGIKDQRAHIFPYAAYKRSDCIKGFQGWPVGKNWQYLYRKGYRCVRIELKEIS